MTTLPPARLALCDFLYYAYLPSREKAAGRAAWWGRLLRDPDVPHFSTVPEASALLGRIVEGLVGETPRVRIGVTSGFDSRGVLGALLTVLPPERIVAFTRGQPGNPDYDKAQGFTQGVLPVHHRVETQQAQFQPVDPQAEAGAGSAPRKTGGPREIAAPTGQLTQGIDGFDGLPGFSGYLGDALTGKHLNAAVRGDFEAARARYLRNNRPFVPEDLLAEFFPAAYDPGHVLPDRPMLPVDLMDPQDQLDFHYRQFQRIRQNASQFEADELAAMDPHERSRARARMARSLAPYADPRWQKSWMLIPFEERQKQRLYKRFLAESYPRIFPDLVAQQADAAKAARKAAAAAAARPAAAAAVPPPGAPPAVTLSAAEAKAAARKASGQRTHTNWELLYEGNAQFRAEYCDPLLTSLAARRGLWFDPMRIHALAREEAYGYGTVLWGLLSMENAIRAGQLPEPD